MQQDRDMLWAKVDISPCFPWCSGACLLPENQEQKRWTSRACKLRAYEDIFQTAVLQGDCILSAVLPLEFLGIPSKVNAPETKF